MTFCALIQGSHALLHLRPSQELESPEIQTQPWNYWNLGLESWNNGLCFVFPALSLMLLNYDCDLKPEPVT